MTETSIPQTQPTETVAIDAADLTEFLFDDPMVAQVASMTGIGSEVRVYIGRDPYTYIVVEPMLRRRVRLSIFNALGQPAPENYINALTYAAGIVGREVANEMGI